MLSRGSCACAISGFVLITTSGGWVARGEERLNASLAQVGTPDDAVAVEWTYRGSGSLPGAAGLQLADLAGDGRKHLVAVSSYFGGYWYILRHSAGDYVQEWASEPVDQ